MEEKNPESTSPDERNVPSRPRAQSPADPADFPNIQAPLLHLRDGAEELEAARREAGLPFPMDALSDDTTGTVTGEGMPGSSLFKPFRFVHGYTLPSHWARRDEEIAELLLELQANHYRILSLVAIGGTGKSALTRKLLDELPKHNVGLYGALWFSFYVEPEFDRFLTEACRYLIPDFEPGAHPSPYEKGVLLREAMEKGHYLFVLDGIEVLLVSDRRRKDFGSFQDRALREFLEGVCEGKRSQVLISSRFPLKDIEGKPGHHVVQLGDLSLTSADELLTSYGVTGAEEDRKKVFSRFSTHALTLQLLGYYLSRFAGGDPRGIGQIQEVAPDAPQGIKLQSVLDSFWERLNTDERFFLTRMSAFRGGVDERSLIILNKTGDVYSPEFRAMTEKLLQSPLVSVERREGYARLTSHPLIKTFFYERMGDSERNQTHRALKDYAQGLPLPDRPRTLEDYQPLLEACHHCLKVGLYTEAYQMYRRNNLDNALRWWGHYSQAQELLEPLREASMGDLPAWQSERWQRSWVENETALLGLLRGDSELARARFLHSAKMDEENADALGESASWQNLASVLTQCGDFKGALEALEKSRILEMTAGRYEKEDLLAGLDGVCRGELGQTQQALDMLSRAIGISTHRANTRAVCYWTWRIGDLYMRSRKPNQADKQHGQALQVARREQFRDYEGHALRGLGDAAIALGDEGRAIVRYANALRVARTLGNPYLENEVRLSMARLAEGKGNLTEAQGQAQQSLGRAEECGYLVQMTEAHLILARCARETRDTQALITHATQAQRLIEKTCHAYTQAELERLFLAEPKLRQAIPPSRAAQ